MAGKKMQRKPKPNALTRRERQIMITLDVAVNLVVTAPIRPHRLDPARDVDGLSLTENQLIPPLCQCTQNSGV